MRADYLLNSGNSIIKVFNFIFKVKWIQRRGSIGFSDRMDKYWTLYTEEWILENGDWSVDTGHLECGHWTLDTGEWRLETGDWSIRDAGYEKEERRERGRTCRSTVESSTTVLYNIDYSSLI